MLPNVYGWTWTPAHLIFIGVFFGVAVTIAVTVLLAWWRSGRDLRAGRADAIRWREEFKELSPEERRCRHEITGEFRQRTCDKAFDCRECTTHAGLVKTPEPADLYYSRGHTWVRPEPDGTFTVGLDEFATSLIGRDARIERPAVGTRLSVHSPAARASRNGHDVRILSPVEGEVVESSAPALFRVRPTGQPVRLNHLLSGREAEMWKMREMERLQMLLAPEPALASLADGGVLVEDMPKADPKADWSRVWGSMLLEP